MRKSEFIKTVNDIYPLAFKEKGDPCGWQRLKGPKDVNNILVCLDVTQEVVDFAVKNNVNIIIHHHPFLFNGLKKTLNIRWKNRVYYQCKENNIGLYALHTNADFHHNGLNHYILTQLGAENIKLWNKYSRLLKGSFPNDTKQTLIAKIKKVFNVDSLHFCGNLNINPLEVVIAGGSGGSFLHYLQDKKRIYLTGDLKWNEWILVQQEDIPVIAIGHYMENLFINMAEDKFTYSFPELKIFKFSIKNPIQHL